MTETSHLIYNMPYDEVVVLDTFNGGCDEDVTLFGIKAKVPYIPQPIIRSPQHYAKHRKRTNLCVNK